MQPLLKQLGSDSESNHSKAIHFPDGLPAFERVKNFVVVGNEEEAPFLWLQSTDNPNLAFIIIDPFLIHPEYRPDISDEDVKFLEIDDPTDAFVLAIVNIRNGNDQEVTANLISPIVINWKKRLAKQVILRNHLDYSVRHIISGAD